MAINTTLLDIPKLLDDCLAMALGVKPADHDTLQIGAAITRSKDPETQKLLLKVSVDVMRKYKPEFEKLAAAQDPELAKQLSAASGERKRRHEKDARKVLKHAARPQ
jgi:hypothetical protein